eukprot:UN30357
MPLKDLTDTKMTFCLDESVHSPPWPDNCKGCSCLSWELELFNSGTELQSTVTESLGVTHLDVRFHKKGNAPRIVEPMPGHGKDFKCPKNQGSCPYFRQPTSKKGLYLPSPHPPRRRRHQFRNKKKYKQCMILNEKMDIMLEWSLNGTFTDYDTVDISISAPLDTNNYIGFGFKPN